MLPLILYIMGDNTTAALIGAGSSAFGGAVGLLTNSAHRQYKYQKKLMQLQNSMNQENATIAYNRSRQLTQDQAMLEKQGKLNAGINTAFGENGHVASAASAPQSDGVSIPTPPDVLGSLNSFQSGINNAVSQLIGISTAKANVSKLNAETEGLEIDNLTRNIKNLKEIGLKDSEIRKNFAELAYQNVVNKYADSRLSAEADSANSKAILDAADSSVRGAMNDIDYLNKVQDLQNKVATGVLTKRQAAVELKKLSVMDSEISKNQSSASLDRASTSVANEQAHLYRTQWEHQNIEKYIKDQSAPALIKAAQLAAEERGPQSISEWTWKVLNNWDNESKTSRILAVLGLPASFVERAAGGAATAYSSAKGNKLGKSKSVVPKPKGFVRKVLRK